MNATEVLARLRQQPDFAFDFAPEIGALEGQLLSVLLDEVERLRASNAALTVERDKARDEGATFSGVAGYALSEQLKRVDEMRADIGFLIGQLHVIEHRQDDRGIKLVAKKYGLEPF